MKHVSMAADSRSPLIALLVGAVAAWPCRSHASAAGLTSDWEYVQEVDVPETGVVKLRVPYDTLGASRPGFEDVRLVDEEGTEIPYVVDRLSPAVSVVRAAKSVSVSLTSTSTLAVIETGVTQHLAGLVLDVPSVPFIKPATVEGSHDRAKWQVLTQGVPVFRLANGPAQLELRFPAGSWPWLRVALDDRRADPVAITGVRLRTGVEFVETDVLPVKIERRSEVASESRIELGLPAANLLLAAIEIDTPEPLFSRELVLSAAGGTDRHQPEQTLARGTVYRVMLEGKAVSAQLSLPVERRIASPRLLLRVLNQDSPPLPISGLRAVCRPVCLVFRAPRPGKYRLLTGNRLCESPRYDLASLAASLKQVPVSRLTMTPLLRNPAYRPPAAVPQLQGIAAPLDPSAWCYRKLVRIGRDGAQQLGLDIEILSRARDGLEDVRLLRGDRQVPFILEYAVGELTLWPKVTEVRDPGNPSRGCWALKLPLARLPLNRFSCASATQVFQRDFELYEEVPDTRGDKTRRSLATARWTRTTAKADAKLELRINQRLETDTLLLVTDNGDNPAVQLADFELAVPLNRIVFKSDAIQDLHLYYGNPNAGVPRYDLSLVADELKALERSDVIAGPEEQLRKSSWSEQMAGKRGGPLFWAALILAVVVLLAIIARLVPRNAKRSEP